MNETENTRDRAINLCRRVHSVEGKALLRAVLLNLDRTSQRKRQQRQDDRANYERLVEAIVSDVLYHHFMQEDGGLHVSRMSHGKKWRYRLTWDSARLKPVLLDQLEAMGYLAQTKGQQVARNWKPKGCYFHETTISAGPVLLTLAEQCGVNSMMDFYADYSTDEITILKSAKAASVDEEGNKIERDAELMDYIDTDVSHAKRIQMQAINGQLASMNVDVNLDVNRELPPSMRLPFNKFVDVRERHLKRYFTCGDTTFQSGGRLFNRPLPFWMWMKKVQRRELLTMNGDYIAELDYSAMNPRLLYAYAQVPMPAHMQDDPYKVPGFERSRDGIKKLFNAMLFGKNLGAWTMYPENMIEEGLDSLFHPAECKPVGEVIRAILLYHAPVAHHFGTGVGHRLQNMESEIMVSLLLQLFEAKIPALPVHDCVIVPYQLQEQARTIMLRVFQVHTGIEGVVKTEASHRAGRQRERVA